MTEARLRAIDREARRVLDELQAGRESRVTGDDEFRADVIARVRRLLEGDSLPLVDGPDD